MVDSLTHMTSGLQLRVCSKGKLKSNMCGVLENRKLQDLKPSFSLSSGFLFFHMHGCVCGQDVYLCNSTQQNDRSIFRCDSIFRWAGRSWKQDVSEERWGCVWVFFFFWRERVHIKRRANQQNQHWFMSLSSNGFRVDLRMWLADLKSLNLLQGVKRGESSGRNQLCSMERPARDIRIELVVWFPRMCM